MRTMTMQHSKPENCSHNHNLSASSGATCSSPWLQHTCLQAPSPVNNSTCACCSMIALSELPFLYEQAAA